MTVAMTIVEPDAKQADAYVPQRVAAFADGGLWAASLGILLCGVIPLAFIAATPATSPITAWPWAVTVLVISGAAYSATIGRGEPRLYQLVFWLFVYVFFGLAPLVQLRRSVVPSTTPSPVAQFLVPAFLLILAGCGAFTAGSWLRSRFPRASAPAKQVRSLSDIRVRVLACFALVCNGYYVAHVGVRTFLSSRDELAAARSAIWGVPTTISLVTGISTGTLLVALLGLMRLWSRGTPRQRPWILMTLSVATLVITVNPISSARYSCGTVWLAILCARGFFNGPRFRVTACAMIVALVVVFPYADLFRRAQVVSIADKGGPVNTLVSGDFDSYYQVSNSEAAVAEAGPTFGRQALAIPLFWVPRSIWPEKPEDTGIWIAKLRHYPFTNLSAPLWAEGYVNGGWPATIFLFGVLGYGLRAQDDRRVRSSASCSPAACIVPFYMIILLRGSLLQATAFLAVIMIGNWWILPRKSDSGAVGSSPTCSA